MIATSFRLPVRDRDLLYVAATRMGQSQSEAVREAIRLYASHVLAGPQTAPARTE